MKETDGEYRSPTEAACKRVVKSLKTEFNYEDFVGMWVKHFEGVIGVLDNSYFKTVFERNKRRSYDKMTDQFLEVYNIKLTSEDVDYLINEIRMYPICKNEISIDEEYGCC